jgi:hypothetical protein
MQDQHRPEHTRAVEDAVVRRTDDRFDGVRSVRRLGATGEEVQLSRPDGGF